MKLKLSTLQYRLFRIACLVLLCIFFNTASAQTFSVSPLIIEFDAIQRDTFTKDITLTNTGTRPLRLYASVHEVEVGAENEILGFVSPSMSDRSTSLTSWLEIKRSRIELPEGQSVVVPLTIRVNPNAESGLYHGYIGFASGPNRDAIEADVMAGKGEGIVLRVAVGTTAKESLRLVSFTTDRVSIFSGKGTMTYELENTGTIPVTLSGDIIIYDGRGREIDAVDLVPQGERIVIAPGVRQSFTKPLPYSNRLGKNKAYLSIAYGDNQTASLQDTNFYLSLPLPYLIGLFTLFFLIMITIVLLVRKATKGRVSHHDAVHDLPMMIRSNNDHNTYDHDIDLKKNQ